MPIFMRYLISTIVVVLDQITKIIADRSIEPVSYTHLTLPTKA